MSETSPRALALLAALSLFAIMSAPFDVRAQFVDDGSDAAIGPADTRTILALVAKNVKDSTDAKVTASSQCGSGASLVGSIAGGDKTDVPVRDQL